MSLIQPATLAASVLDPLGALARPTLAQQAADAIVEAIAASAIQPGERLTDTAIAQRLGVSRNPVREAMKILEAQGIIVSNPHRSVHVVAFDHGKIEQIARVRVAIEKIAFAEATAAYSSNPALLTELDQIIQQMEQQARLDDLNGVTKADLAFHRAVCTASRNQIVLTLWETIARHMRISFNLEIQQETARPKEVPEHHRRLRDVLATGVVSDVEKEIESHILRLQRSS
jgi:DNA-binding GntR family transcriptional regulator